jgi:hypothetical protein
LFGFELLALPFWAGFLFIGIYIRMLKFVKGSTSTLICTLTEKQTITDANYLFVFTSRATNDQVKFVKVNAFDVSTNKERWNEFAIVVNDYFANYHESWWKYEIYEQTSSTNLNPAGLGLLETGLMFLDDNTNMSFTQYSQDVKFTMYDAS